MFRMQMKGFAVISHNIVTKDQSDEIDSLTKWNAVKPSWPTNKPVHGLICNIYTEDKVTSSLWHAKTLKWQSKG